MNNTAKVLVAAAAGFAIGISLGILFAPDKGSETRRKINVQGKKVVDDLTHKFAEEKEHLDGIKDSIVQTVKKTAHEFLEKV